MNFQKINSIFKLILVVITLLNVNVGLSQTTYTVTSTSKDGPGSILEAIDLANNNPGADIIEFTPGLQINAAHPIFTGTSGDFMITITESVTIDGKDGALNGRQRWISSNGNFDNIAICPGNVPSTIILAAMPNFIDIKGGVNVTIKNLSIKQFNSIAEVRENATLNLENFNASEIRSTINCASKGLLSVSSGASLSIKNSSFSESYNWASSGLGTGIVSSSSAGNLTIENSVFYSIEAGNQFLISWQGSNNSKVNIVSSRILGSGGVIVGENTSETNIVNSTIVTKDTGTPRYGERIINSSNGPMNIIACSIKWNSNRCDAICPISSKILIESQNGVINFLESALGFNFTEKTGTLLTTLGVSDTGSFTADTNTWIEPTSNQDASALQIITSQANLFSGLPGFKTSVITNIEYNDAELVSPDLSGVLIDVINTPLMNPIDNTSILTDVLGNERFDANGFRDIGAIQLSLAPVISLSSSGDEFVNLSWQEPLHHDGAPIVRYEYQYVDTHGGSSSVIDAGLNLTANIIGLTNGTAYEFSVRAVYEEGGIEINGPFGNVEIATPLTDQITVPIVTATPENEQVSLSWNLSDLGGRKFNSYVILWKVVGESNFSNGKVISDINSTTTVITGLTNNSAYEFWVSTTTKNGDRSDYGIDTTTPWPSPEISFYPNPTKDLLHIKFIDKNISVNLFSVNGSLIKEVKNKKTIDISTLSTGTYIIYIQTENKKYKGKILKK